MRDINHIYYYYYYYDLNCNNVVFMRKFTGKTIAKKLFTTVVQLSKPLSV